MLYSILSYENTDNLDGVDLEESKVMTQSNSKVLKTNQDNIVRLKQLSPNGQLPHGVLSGGSKEIEKVLASFKSAKRADKVHEALPNANPNWKQQQNGNKKTIFFSKNMDTEEKDKEEPPKQTKRRKMTITKED